MFWSLCCDLVCGFGGGGGVFGVFRFLWSFGVGIFGVKDFEIENDLCVCFKFENFGFFVGGKMNIIFF